MTDVEMGEHNSKSIGSDGHVDILQLYNGTEKQAVLKIFVKDIIVDVM